MRRAEAGETISQEEVKAAVRISRADCIPVTLPPRPAVKHVSVSQSWFAEPPTKEPPPRVSFALLWLLFSPRSSGRRSRCWNAVTVDGACKRGQLTLRQDEFNL